MPLSRLHGHSARNTKRPRATGGVFILRFWRAFVSKSLPPTVYPKSSTSRTSSRQFVAEQYRHWYVTRHVVRITGARSWNDVLPTKTAGFIGSLLPKIPPT